MNLLPRLRSIGRYEDAAVRIAAGASVNHRNEHGATPLMLAARDGDLSGVRQLLETGADSHLAYSGGQTALHFAAVMGHLEIVQALIAHGADPNALSTAGYTPSLDAARFNQPAIVAFLLSHGADATTTDKQGRTATDWLARSGLPAGSLTAREEVDAYRNSPEARQRALDKIRSLMASGLSADEWAARRGCNTLVWGYGSYTLGDPEAEQWARRVGQIIASPELLEACEEQYLRGDALEDARKQCAQQQEDS